MFIVLVAGVGLATETENSYAHRPYFTQSETIALPDGTLGEMRLLHGDGIFVADPVQAVIVDAEGRTVARTLESGAFIIVCPEHRRCHAVDLDARALFEPQPETFREGTHWSEFHGGQEAWGFSRRPAMADEMAIASWQYVKRSPGLWFVAGSAAVSAAAISGRLLPRGGTRWRKLFQILVALVGGSIVIALMIQSLYSVVFGYHPVFLWLAANVVGVAGGLGFLALLSLLQSPKETLPR